MRRMLDPKEALPSTIEFDAEGNRTASKDVKVDGKLKLKSLVSSSNPDGDITKELGGGGGGGGSTEKLYKHTVSASSNKYGTVKITFYSYNNVAINSDTKLNTEIKRIGEIVATGYITNGSTLYYVHSVYFDSSDNKVYADGYQITNLNAGEVKRQLYWLSYIFNYSDDVSAVS